MTRARYLDEIVEFSPALPHIVATLDLDPETLNLKSKGNWVTCYIELPEGYNVADINLATVRLNGTVPAELTPTAIGDYGNDGMPDLMVKFDRAKVEQYVLDHISVDGKFATATLIVSRKLKDGTLFEGSDTIKIILPTPARKCLKQLENP